MMGRDGAASKIDRLRADVNVNANLGLNWFIRVLRSADTAAAHNLRYFESM